MTCVAVIGAKGNMGQRYCAILRHLKIDYFEIDKDVGKWDLRATHIIIATPTDTHYDLLHFYADFKLPILCEKPLTKIKAELALILNLEVPLRMINQYEFYSIGDPMDSLMDAAMTKYDYFKTGTDGLDWDCLNITGTAKGSVELQNKSPIWTCQINGYHLDLADMDMMYILNIQDWIIHGKLDNKEYIEKSHMRVMI